MLGECLWNYIESISRGFESRRRGSRRSSVWLEQLNVSHPPCRQDPGISSARSECRTWTAEAEGSNPSSLTRIRARSSVGERPPFKRHVVGSTPTGRSTETRGGMPVGVHRFGRLPKGLSRFPCPPHSRRKENSANAEGPTVAQLPTDRAGSTPLHAGAQMANAEPILCGADPRAGSSLLVAGTKDVRL